MDESILGEFEIEAREMLEESEDRLLAIENGGDFHENYNGIFRAFHSLKGAAGMFGLENLQKHMHQLETLFESLNKIGSMNKDQVDYFLKGVDGAKTFLDGNEILFDHLSQVQFFSMNKTSEVLDSSSSDAVTGEETDEEEYEYEYEYVDTEEDGEAQEEDFSKFLQETTKEKIEKVCLLNARVMIVDDEEEITEIISLMMEGAGFKTACYTNGNKAINDIDTFKPDLILSDLNMPEISGLDMVRKIHEEIPDLPVVFISGFITKEVLIESLQNGVYSFIEKPFNENQIISIGKQAVLKYRTFKLLNKSLNYIMYQYNDLDQFLKEQGKESVRSMMRNELKNIIEQKKMLSSLSKSN